MRGLLVAMFVVQMLPAAAVAQGTPGATKPSKYLMIEQVIVPEGRAGLHPGLMVQVRRAADTIKAASTWIGATHLTGDLRRVSYLSFYDDFASIEKDFDSLRRISIAAAESDSNFSPEWARQQVAPRLTISVFRDDLSYQADKVPPSEVRYWSVTTMFLKAGHMSDLTNQLKEEIELLKRGGLDHHVLVYQVLAGLPSSGSVFYVMNPMRGLAEMDRDDSEKARAVFTPEVRHRFEVTNQQMISSVESDLLAVRPDLSRPPASYFVSNPTFWKVSEPESPR